MSYINNKKIMGGYVGTDKTKSIYVGTDKVYNIASSDSATVTLGNSGDTHVDVKYGGVRYNTAGQSFNVKPGDVIECNVWQNTKEEGEARVRVTKNSVTTVVFSGDGKPSGNLTYNWVVPDEVLSFSSLSIRFGKIGDIAERWITIVYNS